MSSRGSRHVEQRRRSERRLKPDEAGSTGSAPQDLGNQEFGKRDSPSITV